MTDISCAAVAVHEMSALSAPSMVPSVLSNWDSSNTQLRLAGADATAAGEMAGGERGAAWAHTSAEADARCAAGSDDAEARRQLRGASGEAGRTGIAVALRHGRGTGERLLVATFRTYPAHRQREQVWTGGAPSATMRPWKRLRPGRLRTGASMSDRARRMTRARGR